MNGNPSKLIIKFERESIGTEQRKKNLEISQKLPGGTPIEKVNFQYSISKSKKSPINTANVIQFPVKLAFASTAHKIQGATIAKPQKIILNVNDTFNAAMVYVMLSRVCSLDQILLLDEFPESKMYPDMRALVELKRLDNISLNKNQTPWEREDNKSIKISSLNCRSLKKHYEDIRTDNLLLKSDLITLQETWLDNDEMREDLNIPGYELAINSKGKGRGIATYYNIDIFKHVADIKKDKMQLSKFCSENLDLVAIYRSKQGNQQDMNQLIKQLENRNVPQMVVGDLNFHYLEEGANSTKKFFKKENYSQLIMEPTHIEGNILDQAYVRDESG